MVLKNINFSRNCTKFHMLTIILLFKYNWNFLDQILLPYEMPNELKTQNLVIALHSFTEYTSIELLNI